MIQSKLIVKNRLLNNVTLIAFLLLGAFKCQEAKAVYMF